MVRARLEVSVTAKLTLFVNMTLFPTEHVIEGIRTQ